MENTIDTKKQIKSLRIITNQGVKSYSVGVEDITKIVIDLRNIRPNALASPILAIPVTKVVNTSGAIIILIKRKNATDTKSRLAAIDFILLGSVIPT